MRPSRSACDVILETAANQSAIPHPIELITIMFRRILVILLLGIIAVFLLRHAGSFLVVNDPKPADVIVVLGGGNNDSRYRNG